MCIIWYTELEYYCVKEIRELPYILQNTGLICVLKYNWFFRLQASILFCIEEYFRATLIIEIMGEGCYCSILILHWLDTVEKKDHWCPRKIRGLILRIPTIPKKWTRKSMKMYTVSSFIFTNHIIILNTTYCMITLNLLLLFSFHAVSLLRCVISAHIISLQHELYFEIHNLFISL